MRNLISFRLRDCNPYTARAFRSPDWLKMKNADAPAVKREAEEDWSKVRRDERGSATGQGRIMIYGPKSDGTYIIEFRMADG